MFNQCGRIMLKVCFLFSVFVCSVCMASGLDGDYAWKKFGCNEYDLGDGKNERYVYYYNIGSAKYDGDNVSLLVCHYREDDEKGRYVLFYPTVNKDGEGKHGAFFVYDKDKKLIGVVDYEYTRKFGIKGDIWIGFEGVLSGLTINTDNVFKYVKEEFIGDFFSNRKVKHMKEQTYDCGFWITPQRYDVGGSGDRGMLLYDIDSVKYESSTDCIFATSYLFFYENLSHCMTIREKIDFSRETHTPLTFSWVDVFTKKILQSGVIGSKEEVIPPGTLQYGLLQKLKFFRHR